MHKLPDKRRGSCSRPVPGASPVSSPAGMSVCHPPGSGPSWNIKDQCYSKTTLTLFPASVLILSPADMAALYICPILKCLRPILVKHHINLFYSVYLWYLWLVWHPPKSGLSWHVSHRSCTFSSQCVCAIYSTSVWHSPGSGPPWNVSHRPY